MKALNQQTIKINQITYCHHTVYFDFPSLDLIDWIESQSIYPKFVWKNKKDGDLTLALGALLTFNFCPEIESIKELRIWGVKNFDPKEESFFFLPAIEIMGSKIFYHTLSPIQTPFPEALKRIKPINYKLDLSHRIDSPDKDGWLKLVEMALHKISHQEIEKVVLSRCVSFDITNRQGEGFFLLKKLPQKDLTIYALSLKRDHCFIGATPEMLYERRGNKLMSEMIAGTHKDEMVLKSPHFFKEHSYVPLYIESIFSKICKRYAMSELNILKLKHLCHLYQKIEGELMSSISDRDIISLLHPTPAIAGYPVDKALKIIHDHETYERKWYSAPIGFIGNEQTELAVAIRSILIEDGKLYLFSGVGLVDSSCAEKEWEELELKITSWLDAIEGFG
ncbi:MAG: isochorismate synthase [Rhabdochlamydiaceae bacterium]